MYRDYMHIGTITEHDIASEINNQTRLNSRSNQGWILNGERTTLRELAELWAEQENDCESEDRGTFSWWLDTHIEDGRLEEPEPIIVHPQGLEGDWTVVDKLEYSGVELCVVVSNGLRFVINGDIPVSGDLPLDFTTLADELDKHPSIVRNWVKGRPIIEAYRACGVERKHFAPLDPDWHR
ncbi:hypothetical protein [Bifidobacterium callitrichidarum]|uniref:Uncharacterized protein n=1 Tax=Bifidobacterium callitrichidarum TaxID=2052941 RepID=A0A2U2N9F3_9BIFI|nr:hypothetical protein [Bifidobacterium callitrichidarum]PWG65690.1 hypothetical protein DF196_07080 [Bifidobacterium callitrichidarum]